MNENTLPLDAVASLRNSLAMLARRLRQLDRQGAESWTELMALGAIERGQGEATPSQIAAQLELRSSNMAQVLGSLEARGLIERTPDASDRRKVRLSLTGQGQQLVRHTREQRDQWLAQAMMASLTAQEQGQLLEAGQLLQRVANAGQGSTSR